MSATSQLVCIKRPEPSLSAVFEDMYLNERLVDVTISCPDGQLQAHKLVLAASSSYFSGLFEKLPNPFHYPVVFMKDMRIKDLKLIIDFIYRGQLTVSQERLASLVKSAEGLQITGLTSMGDLVPSNSIESNTAGNSRSTNQAKLKRSKKSISTSSSNLSQHQAVFNRASYQSRQDHDLDSRLNSPQPNKLMEQSMITGESIDNSHANHHFSYAASNNDPISTRNLSSHQHQLNTPSPSIHLQQQQHQQQHLPILDQHHHQQHFSNQLQVLSHSLAANRSSLAQGSTNGQQSSQMVQQQSRGRVHPCNICWKTFREKANLKRHLQVHSVDRTIYACPDCNKTFSWKDNYIRHTKTAHHMNNARPQS